MASLPPLSQLAGNHGPLFDGLWEKLGSRGGGNIDAVTAAGFLKTSQLREPVLHKIWEMSDAGGKGYLDKQGFFMALRLVAACQNGKEPSVANLSLSDPPPNFVGVDTATVTKNKWTIEADDHRRYDQMFQNLKPVGGKVAGDKAKPIMMASKLPLDALGKIWNLSDIDRDGLLDAHEFAVAMRLIALCQAGETLPATLPSSLLPPGRTTGILPSSSTPLQPSPVTSRLRSQSPRPASPGGRKSSTEWIITPDIKAKYDTYFEGIDKDHDGFVSGEEARGLFMASNLPQNVLASVWSLCDIQKNGKLNAEQFALAMFLIAEKVRGKDLPKELSANMIPPSVGKQQTVGLTTTSITTPTTAGPPSTSAPSLLPTPSSLLPTSAPLSSIASLSAAPTSTPPVTTTATSAASSAFGFGPESGFSSDFSAIKDRDNITNEIDSIRREKNKLQEDIRQKQELIQQRKGEIETLQDDVEAYSKQREALEKEKVEAQGQLERLDSERTKFEGQLAGLKQQCREEQEEIERLKSQLTQQESSKRAQAEELERLQEQLEGLHKEEREYKEKVEAVTAELEKFQKANQNIQNEISQMRQKIDSLKEEHQLLTNALPLYPPVSTPGSTPGSSVVNINDVGQLSAELHVPHLGEQDAISARATAGSSSPVSSISGFSTNSHLEEGAAEDMASKEDKQRSDPFASTSSTNTDPFAAFSVSSTGDPFASTGGMFTGKPSDVSAFDPFGPSDPFKSSAGRLSSGGEDLFKTDPFSSVSSGGGTPGASSAAATDPFSGQDPFSSDPFATSSDSKNAGQGMWSGPSPFGVDPFGTQQAAHTPTDPFASGDPFGDDPFSPSSMGTNPFPTTSTTDAFSSTAKSSQQWSNVPEPLPKPGPNATEDERLAWATHESKREEALRKQRKLQEEEELAKVLRDSLSH